MGNIKEPKGIDFIIQSEPLTEKARQEISEFIRNYKKRISRKVHSPQMASSKKRKVLA